MTDHFQLINDSLKSDDTIDSADSDKENSNTKKVMYNYIYMSSHVVYSSDEINDCTFSLLPWFVSINKTTPLCQIPDFFKNTADGKQFLTEQVNRTPVSIIIILKIGRICYIIVYFPRIFTKFRMKRTFVAYEFNPEMITARYKIQTKNALSKKLLPNTHLLMSLINLRTPLFILTTEIPYINANLQ